MQYLPVFESLWWEGFSVLQCRVVSGKTPPDDPTELGHDGTGGVVDLQLAHSRQSNDPVLHEDPPVHGQGGTGTSHGSLAIRTWDTSGTINTPDNTRYSPCVAVVVPIFVVNPIKEFSLQIFPETLLVSHLHLRGEERVQRLGELVIVSAEEGRHTESH